MSVTPNINNCCDLALTKCLRIDNCSYFCLDQRRCQCLDTSCSYEDVDGGWGGSSANALHGHKLAFDGSCSGCCGSVKQGDTVKVYTPAAVLYATYTVTKIEAGKMTLTVLTTTAAGVTGAIGTGQLVLNGINGNLCSVFLDAANSGASIDVRFNIIRSTATGTCSASCACACSCAC
jgi:hypothetical protein